VLARGFHASAARVWYSYFPWLCNMITPSAESQCRITVVASFSCYKIEPGSAERVSDNMGGFSGWLVTSLSQCIILLSPPLSPMHVLILEAFPEAPFESRIWIHNVAVRWRLLSRHKSDLSRPTNPKGFFQLISHAV